MHVPFLDFQTAPQANVALNFFSGFCCIEYSVCSDADSFTLNVLPTAAAVTGSLCTLDYIIIEGKGTRKKTLQYHPVKFMIFLVQNHLFQ